jgi:hypothetical protein
MKQFVKAIKCGKCSSFEEAVYHATVQDVRACYGVKKEVKDKKVVPPAK